MSNLIEDIQEAARIEGFESGTKFGFIEGNEVGLEVGQIEGFEQGTKFGFIEGNEVGLEVGQIEGFEQGTKFGYEQGYADAEAKYQNAIEALLVEKFKL